MWFDTHFHLDEEDDAEQVFATARAVDVTRFLVLGTSYDDCPRTMALADPANGVYVAAGLHPHVADSFVGTEPFREWLALPGAIAVGEIGLDYHYDISARESQRRVLETFFLLAQELNLPAVIHCREAFDDCHDILKANCAPGARILIHSFADTPRELEQWLELGAMVSVNGMVTFNKADNIRESLAHIPLERLLLETDSPYLAPKPYRGQRNSPANIPIIGQRVAEEKGLSVGEVQRITTENALKFFGL